ncbi:MAG: 30S ribosomal protein S6 [Methylovulum sp.]|nr:MAG: 30S ribosomal protein S6 [Methylovulum sp.]
MLPIMMRQYELMVVFRPDFDTKQRDEALRKLIGSVKVIEVTDLGKKRLAYPIAKHEEGIYVLAKLEGEALKVGDIEKQARLVPDVIRYLLTATK